jgi:hypothetical protein
MGGQACVLYGAAEFSRDLDLAVLCETANLIRLQQALDDLQAEPVAFPPLSADNLLRGHGVHFRCHTPDTDGLRIDVMAVQRGVAPFAELWERRTSVVLPDGKQIELLSLPDLVQAKKTQRDKDWPMIRRLVETNYFENRDDPTDAQVAFWLRELRTPDLLIECVRRFPQAVEACPRPAVVALRGASDSGRGEPDPDARAVSIAEAAIEEEERAERQRDREYWQPLRRELEQMRHRRG